MKNYITSSEIAKRFHTTIDAVRYYEKLGLLNPERDPDNGYRHFTNEDIVTMGLIQELKHLHFPLSLIVKLRQNRKAEATFELLNQEKAQIDQEIERLQAAKAAIEARIAFMERYLHRAKLHEINVVYFERRNCLLVSQDDIPEDAFPLILSKIAYQKNLTIPMVGVSDGYVLDREAFFNHKDPKVRAVIYDGPGICGDYRLPEGDYLTLLVKRQENIEPYIEAIQNYLEAHSLDVISDVYSFYVIDEDESEDPKEHRILLQMRVKKRP
ncbi:MAG: MerR family transcriptional regulator [Pseudoramibacter sp.]